MNAGRDYAKACRQAQANADVTLQPRYLLFAQGVWWIEAEPSLSAPPAPVVPFGGAVGTTQTFYPRRPRLPFDEEET